MMENAYTNTVEAKIPSIDLCECHKIFADYRGEIVKLFQGCPVRVVPGLEENEWFIGISKEMFDELEAKKHV